MIDRERFEQLAALLVAGEATESEQDEMNAALAEEPSLVDELADLAETDAALRVAAGSARPVQIQPMPAHVVEMLDQTRRDAKPVIPFPQPKRKRLAPAWIALAACVTVAAGIAVFYPKSPGYTSKDIAIFAPRGVTGSTQPRIAWDARPGQKYDLWIITKDGDQTTAPVLFKAENITGDDLKDGAYEFAKLEPMPALDQESRPRTRLEPGTDYRLLVCIAGAKRIAGVAVPFRTAQNATKAGLAPSSTP